ncbi:MAG: hypothetical protein PUP92_00865 [Rhizonema sp. PD38]|nr:hypothetical protein [Rhizonema sp. PD38]
MSQQQQNPQPSQPVPQPGQTSANQPMQRQTKTGKYTEKFLMNIWEPLDKVGQALMGDYWKTVYLSVQDAIALYIILKIPDLIGQRIFGKSFSNFGDCLKENALGASRYACFIMVVSDFLLWIVIAGRIIGRFLADLKDLRKGSGKGGSGHGSNQP